MKSVCLGIVKTSEKWTLVVSANALRCAFSRSPRCTHIMRPHPLPLGVDVADEICVVALDLEIVHDHAAVGLPVAIGHDGEHGPAGAGELLPHLDRIGRRPADVDDEERMPVSGDDLLGLPQGVHDLDLLEVVGGAAVESDHLFELGRGRWIVLVTGPDEVADLDFFDRLGGCRGAGVGRAPNLTVSSATGMRPCCFAEL